MRNFSDSHSKSNNNRQSLSRSTVEELIAKIAATPPAISETKLFASQYQNSPQAQVDDDSDGELKIADDDEEMEAEMEAAADAEAEAEEENRKRMEAAESSAVTLVKS